MLDKDGVWREAVVKSYEKQKMYDLTFKAGLTEKVVTCTRNHRWILADGSITEHIEVGDKLTLAKEFSLDYKENNTMWSFGFVIGDGCDIRLHSKDRKRITNGSMHVRLCGEKIKYLQKFLDCGYSIQQKFENGDVIVSTRGNGSYKQVFLDNKIWKILSHDDLANILYGYLAADGHITSSDSYMIETADARVKEFVEFASPTIGYYAWSKKERKGNTNYKESRTLYEILLVKKQRENSPWILTEIKASRSGENGNQTAWCIEEPITHSFTLDGGMVTGNCLSIPFDELLATGFNTRQTDVRPANSIGTALQLVAVIFQLQSLQQFGGVSATHLDWTLVPYVRKSFFKHYKTGLKYIECLKTKSLEKELELLSDFNPESVSVTDPSYRYAKAREYALDMTEKETYQAVEGLYHNLNY